MLVTHDIDEALRLADHLVLMDGGEVVQQGEPMQMLLEPKNAFVETFFGRSELGVRLLSLRGVSDYLRRDERLAGGRVERDDDPARGAVAVRCSSPRGAAGGR
ncbi:Osmoprotectant ABC transporter ATP-binding subunit YehX [Klebsiella michiganensis]|uniref:Osmoprotectant ABC transporter ATP-binding subunit YehX n=1 Tax=Klebsiella michiganensis TaxID=1134687 RepID=A0A7H4PPV8_9ENTR|nr:Osmoprotectant ABC transporter ATP-binding subunit YehX [Klebsiella michiganensis]